MRQPVVCPIFESIRGISRGAALFNRPATRRAFRPPFTTAQGQKQTAQLGGEKMTTRHISEGLREWLQQLRREAQAKKHRWGRQELQIRKRLAELDLQESRKDSARQQGADQQKSGGAQ
jgi:hypothetical protein